MDRDTPRPNDGSVDELNASFAAIVRSAPGPLERVRIGAGDAYIDVSWRVGDPAAAPFAPEVDAADSGGVPVRAELVGTFYGRPAPDQPEFVTVGATVAAGDQVGVIEAMKLFTPVVTGVAGEVVAVHVSDGEPVEYDQALMEIQVSEEHEVAAA